MAGLYGVSSSLKGVGFEITQVPCTEQVEQILLSARAAADASGQTSARRGYGLCSQQGAQYRRAASPDPCHVDGTCQQVGKAEPKPAKGPGVFGGDSLF